MPAAPTWSLSLTVESKLLVLFLKINLNVKKTTPQKHVCSFHTMIFRFLFENTSDHSVISDIYF